MNRPSLYDSADLDGGPGSEPRPEPGTALTASIETIDNDRLGGVTFSAGVVR